MLFLHVWCSGKDTTLPLFIFLPKKCNLNRIMKKQPEKPNIWNLLHENWPGLFRNVNIMNENTQKNAGRLFRFSASTETWQANARQNSWKTARRKKYSGTMGKVQRGPHTTWYYWTDVNFVCDGSIVSHVGESPLEEKKRMVTRLGLYVLSCDVLLHGNRKKVSVCVYSNTDIHGESGEGGKCKWSELLTMGCTDARDIWVFIILSFQLFSMLEIFPKSNTGWKPLFLPNHPFVGEGKSGRKESKSDFNRCEKGGVGNCINVNGINCEKLCTGFLKNLKADTTLIFLPVCSLSFTVKFQP